MMNTKAEINELKEHFVLINDFTHLSEQMFLNLFLRRLDIRALSYKT
jgi:hypothetical protein